MINKFWMEISADSCVALWNIFLMLKKLSSPVAYFLSKEVFTAEGSKMILLFNNSEYGKRHVYTAYQALK